MSLTLDAAIYRLVAVLAGVLFFMSCISSARTVDDGRGRNCAFSYEGKTFTWVRMDQKRLTLDTARRQTRLPFEYEVFRIKGRHFEKLLKGVKESDEALRIRVPVSGECHEFELKNSNALSQALSEKFPDIISLKGRSVNDEMITIRIDYTNGNLKAEINHGGQIYLLSTWTRKQKSYYLIYKKENAGYEKMYENNEIE